MRGKELIWRLPSTYIWAISRKWAACTETGVVCRSKCLECTPTSWQEHVTVEIFLCCWCSPRLARTYAMPVKECESGWLKTKCMQTLSSLISEAWRLWKPWSPNTWETCKEKAFQLEHKHRATTKQIQELELDLERLHHRDTQLNEEVARLENDIRYMEIDIELKEQERERLRERSIFPNGKDIAVEKIASEISELRYKIPACKKEIAATKGKMSFLLQRQQQLKTNRETLVDVTRDLKKARTESTNAITEMKRIDRCLVQLREIHKTQDSGRCPKENLLSHAHRHTPWDRSEDGCSKGWWESKDSAKERVRHNDLYSRPLVIKVTQ